MCAAYQASLPRLATACGWITPPTLALRGERDRHVPPAQATRLHAAVPGSRLRVLEGAEHWTAWHRAADVAAEMLAFLTPPGSDR